MICGGAHKGRPYRGMCLWVVMGDGRFANRPYGGLRSLARGGDGFPPSREQRVRVGMAPLGGQILRGDRNGGWGRVPTRDAPTGEGFLGAEGKGGSRTAPTRDGERLG